MIEALKAMMGDANANVIGRCFELMGVAEQEIEHAQKRDPENKAAIWRSFEVLMPTGEMSQMDERVYRSHARELIRRVAKGEDTRPATDAEVLTAICRTMLAAPLTNDAAALAYQLFKRVMPGAGHWTWEIRETYPNAAAELDHQLRRPLRVEDRVVTEKVEESAA